MISGKSFMITGATGRLGCELTERLEQLGAEVYPVVLKGYPSTPKRVPWRSTQQPIKISNERELKKLPPPDFIIHLHWCVDRNLSFAEQIVEELYRAIKELSFFWQWIKDVRCQKIINISSTKVFSWLNGETVLAHQEPRPCTPYGITKLSAEKFLDAFFAQTEQEVVHLRLGSVASWGEHPTQLMTSLYQSCFFNRRIELRVNLPVSLLYIDEAIDLIIKCAIDSNRRLYHVIGHSSEVGKIASIFERKSGKKLCSDRTIKSGSKKDPVIISDCCSFNDSWIRRTDLEEMIQKIINLYQLA